MRDLQANVRLGVTDKIAEAFIITVIITVAIENIY